MVLELIELGVSELFGQLSDFLRNDFNIFRLCLNPFCGESNKITFVDHLLFNNNIREIFLKCLINVPMRSILCNNTALNFNFDNNYRWIKRMNI